MQQLPLGVRLGEAARFEGFVAGPNAQVLEQLTGGAPPRVLWLWGRAGTGKTHLLQAACAAAGITAADVDYVNAHGTSTPLGDIAETVAVKRCFGDHAKKLAVSSTKSMTGHLLGGAGGIETVFTALSVHNDIIPPTINYENPSEECDLDYVPNTARKSRVDIAMSNSFGFGGTNAALLLAKYHN